MRNLIAIAIFALGVGSAAAAAGVPVKWNDRAYACEFLFMQESGEYDRTSWEALPPEEMPGELARAKQGAERRLEEVRKYYTGMTAKWELEEVDAKLGMLDGEHIASVKLWFSPEHSAYLERKLALVGGMNDSYRSGSLTEGEVVAAAPYISAAAAAQLKTLAKAGAGGAQAAARKEARKNELSKKMDGVKSAYNASLERSGGGKKFFDGAGLRGESPDGTSVRLSGNPAADGRGTVSDNYRNSHAKTVSGGAVPGLGGAAAAAPGGKQAAFSKADLARLDSVVSDMKKKRQASGSENGWLGNFRQSLRLAKADSGCSGWAEATLNAIKSDPVLSQKYEAGYVRGFRNPLGAVTKWPPSVPTPTPHFVAVVWPKGTDPNKTAIYVDAWNKKTKRGPIKEYTYEFSYDFQDKTPTVHYDREVKKQITTASGKKMIVTETVETSVPLVEGNPWVFVK